MKFTTVFIIAICLSFILALLSVLIDRAPFVAGIILIILAIGAFAFAAYIHSFRKRLQNENTS